VTVMREKEEKAWSEDQAFSLTFWPIPRSRLGERISALHGEHALRFQLLRSHI
jgi:hypothetical protein